jgi:hypothetical protein
MKLERGLKEKDDLAYRYNYKLLNQSLLERKLTKFTIKNKGEIGETLKSKNTVFSDTTSKKTMISNDYKYNHLSELCTKEHPISNVKSVVYSINSISDG